MKKRNAVVLGVGIILLALILLPIMIFGNSKENSYTVNVSVENGVAVPDKVTYDFDKLGFTDHSHENTYGHIYV